MATFGSLKTELAQKLDESYLGSQIATAINRTIDYYKRDQFWFNTTSTNITLTTGSPTVTLPSDFLYELDNSGLVINYSQSRYPLQKITALDYDSMNSEATGLPRYYRNNGNSIELYPYPDQSYTLILRYVKDYDELTSDNQSNDWTQFPRLIVAKTLADLFMDQRKEVERFTAYQAIAEDEYLRIRKQNAQRIATGTLSTACVNL